MAMIRVRVLGVLGEGLVNWERVFTSFCTMLRELMIAVTVSVVMATARPITGITAISAMGERRRAGAK
jgi:hypothetical protein